MSKVMESYFWQSCFFQSWIKVPLDKVIMVYRPPGLIWKYKIMGIGRTSEFPFLNDKNLISKTMRDISTLTGISLGAVNSVVRILAERNFVESKGRAPNIRRKLTNLRELEDHFAQILRAFPDRKIYIKQSSSIDVEQL